ncbi:MAG: glutamate--tRNA ligase [Rikenellaceae bacterium]|nr:glutamate--tRNA ligase [Rikenellaceae bacterium]
MSNRKIRVRFAPSPTGPLHIGGVRTALYNYFFAKKQGGNFILRIEDTDSQRFVPGAEEYINKALNWCGIKIDEGVREGGAYGPYKQSERREIYLNYAEQLVKNGNAYYAFDTAEELNAIRSQYESEGKTFSYNYSVREKLPTSLSLPENEIKERLERGDNWVIRFKMPESEEIIVNDLIRGEIKVNSCTLDDKVLYKSSDKLPTYHLANIVDDHLMEISHVIRGEEWLPSLPLHYKLYEALGWSDTKPEFAHLPLLLKPTGSGKLSKRDGDKLGFPVFPLEWKSPEGDISRGYREDGYFPDAFVNMLSLLGWNPGDEREIFSMEELIELFSLEKVGKSGSRFDPEKAKWFNAQYLKTKSNPELTSLFLPILNSNGINVDKNKVEHICGLIKDRATFVSDFWELSKFFFIAPDSYEEKAVKKFWKGENPQRISELMEVIQKQDDFSSSALEKIVHDWIHEKEYPMGQIMNCFRLCIVGESKGPNMFDICEIIGKDETIGRLEKGIDSI